MTTIARAAETQAMPNTTPIDVRAFVAADYGHALELWSRTEGLDLNESDTEEAVGIFLNRNPGFSAIATAPDGEVVGAVLCGHDGRRGSLHHLAVAKSHRGRSIAKSLLEFCFVRLAVASIPRCNIFLYNENEEGTKFWLHNGWKESTTWKTLQKPVPC